MKRVIRRTPAGGIQLRTAGDGAEGVFEALVMNYNVVDDYNTTFIPGVFTKSLKTRLPRVCWSHDWAEPIGQVTSYVDSEKDLRVTCQLDDFSAVPQARRAWVQMQSGTIDQFSVGFWMQQYDMPKDDGGPIAIKRGQLDEISPVLVGAVPKTKLLAVRSRLLRVTANGDEIPLSVDAVAQIILQQHAGELDLEEALHALKVLAGVAESPEPPEHEQDPEHPKPPDEDPPPTTPTAEEIEAQAINDKAIELEDFASIDEALSLVGMS